MSNEHDKTLKLVTNLDRGAIEGRLGELRKAAQSHLARSVSKRENRPTNLFFTAAWSALVNVSAILSKSPASARQWQNNELSCQIC